jgi:hypothetical protein
VLVLSSVPFGQLGLRDDLPPAALPLLTWRVLSKVPDVVLLGGTLLYGIHWITRRREEVRRVEGNGPRAGRRIPTGGAEGAGS